MGRDASPRSPETAGRKIIVQLDGDVEAVVEPNAEVLPPVTAAGLPPREKTAVPCIYVCYGPSQPVCTYYCYGMQHDMNVW